MGQGKRRVERVIRAWIAEAYPSLINALDFDLEDDGREGLQICPDGDGWYFCFGRRRGGSDEHSGYVHADGSCEGLY